MNYLKYTVLILIGVIVMAILYLWIAGTLSLDDDYRHTRAASELPLFDGKDTAPIVRVEANGMEFRTRIAGFDNPAPRGDLLLLHGFPETSIMYQPLIDAAAAAGFRVAAPDQRGYSPGARPAGRDSYGGAELINDTMAIADALDFDRFHLVGHDWGAGVGWGVTAAHPERLKTYTALSIPHIASFGKALAEDPDQQSRSAYMGFFQLPFLPESIFAMDDFSVLRGLYEEHPAEELEEYLTVFGEPGALTAALNWYRAAPTASMQVGKVSTPILFIWGNQDPAVGRAAVEAQGDLIDGPLTEMELDTGHWLMATARDEVVAAVLAHIARFN